MAKMCGHKQRFANKIEAEKQAAQAELAFNRTFRCYKCSFCGAWHFGGGSHRKG